MESEILRDYIVGRAFKAVRFDLNARRLVPLYTLEIDENEDIEAIALEQGFTRDEYRRFKDSVLTSSVINTASAHELKMPQIGYGDIIELYGSQGECLRLLRLQATDFLVLGDDTLDARPGDIMTLLQYRIELDAKAVFLLRRGGTVIPARNMAYCIPKVCSIKTLRSDATLFKEYLRSNSTQIVSSDTAAKAYGNVFDLAFNGFAGPQVDLEQRGQLYEIDPINLTYRVNPAYNPGRVSRHALLQELSNGFLIEEQADDFTRIVHVADGQLALSPREGYNILTCKRQATISLC